MLHTITKVFAIGSIVWLGGCGNSGSTYIEEAPPLLEIGVDENLVVEENLLPVTHIELINGDVQVDELHITGPDREHFELVAGSQLSFVSAPDFENPASDDSDNIYEITSSSLNKTISSIFRRPKEEDKYMLGDMFPGENYGLITINTNEKVFEIELKDINGKRVRHKLINIKKG